MNYDTEDIKTINAETTTLLEKLRKHSQNISSLAANSGLKGHAGNEMKRVENALNQLLDEAEGETNNVSTDAEDKEGTQLQSDRNVDDIISQQ